MKAMKTMLFALMAGLAMMVLGNMPAVYADDALSPKCADLPGEYHDLSGDKHASAQCWQELDDVPGCYVYRDHYHTNDFVLGTGKCRGGVYSRGTLIIETAIGDVFEGRFIKGMRNGRWVERYANGVVSEGSYIDGKRNGHWVVRNADGDGSVREGSYVDGEIAGLWIFDGKAICIGGKKGLGFAQCSNYCESAAGIQPCP